MRDDLPGGVVTLLLTDIEGSTRLLHELGAERYAAVLADHRRLLREAFTRNGGVEVDTQGDAFFVAFPNAVGGLRAAADSQRALANHGWPSNVNVRVRMGLDTGTPQRTDEGYVGIEVHAAARIASAGHGGQVLLSSRTVDALGGDLPGGSTLRDSPHDGWSLRDSPHDGWSLRDLGRHRLKDLDDEQRLFQIILPDLPGDFPPPRSLATRPNNLPTPLTAFIGRTGLVATLRELMLGREVRLVTLTGPGGTGKSRLSLHVATDLLHHFADGVYFVPLAAVNEAARVSSAIAAALGVREEDGVPLLDSIGTHLTGKALLLVIDNFEQVMAAARDVGALLKRCQGLKLIVTSREALRIAGERVIGVPPLELPDATESDVQTALSYEAVRLFVERAHAVRPDFVLDDSNVSAVISICRRVDALPLAVELAAARIRSLAPERLEVLLERRLKVLTGGGAELLDHQRTLRSLIVWSYELLNPQERTLWRRLSVFSGGCEMDAAQRVCDLDGDIDVELDIDSLVAKSIVQFDTGDRTGTDKVIRGEDSRPRIAMLQTLREFALERLDESGEGETLRSRHRDWCVEFAEAAERAYRGPQLDTTMRRLDRDHDNLRSALLGCFEVGDSGIAPALRLAAALWFYWYQRGFLSEGQSWLERSLALPAGAHPRERARALLGITSLCRQQNRSQDALRFCEEALQIYRSLDDLDGAAVCSSQLGAIYERLGDLPHAAQLLEEALVALRTLGNVERVAFTLVALGAVEQIRGNLTSAAAHYTESLSLARKLSDKNGTATALVNLGEIAQLNGNVAEATRLFRESLKLYLELGLKIAIAYCLEVLAGIDAAENRPAEAGQLFGAAARLREEINAPVEPFNLERYQRDIDTVRNALGEERFTEVEKDGRRMPLARIVDLAMIDAEA